MVENKKPPCFVGQVLDLEITDLTHRGEGVGKNDDFTVFVPLALPGDIARVKISAVHKNYGRANMLSLKSASPGRVNPPCPYFPHCGGCQLQHLSYPQQLEWKQKRVSETLKRIAGTKTDILPVRGMAQPWRFRNRAEIHLGISNGLVRAGFYKHRSHHIIDIETCPVQHPGNCSMINIIRRSLQEYMEGAADRSERNFLPFGSASVRFSFSSGRALIILTGSGGAKSGSPSLDQSKLNKLCALLQAGAKQVPAGIIYYPTGHKKERPLVLAGQPYLEEDIAPFTYRISPRSFFQVNPAQASVLYAAAASLSGRPHTAYDLYCGTGNFALYLSRTAGQVIGVDSDPAAIKDARKNAALNRVSNTRFINSRAEDISPLLLKDRQSKTVFINPPRGGCSPAILDAVAGAKPARIVYISCNPATLARDTGHLQQKGFNVKVVQPVDMFPHTSHIETVVLLER